MTENQNNIMRLGWLLLGSCIHITVTIANIMVCFYAMSKGVFGFVQIVCTLVSMLCFATWIWLQREPLRIIKNVISERWRE